MTKYDQFSDFAKTLASEAADIMQEHFSLTQPQTEIKEDYSPVTIADTAINQHVIDRVKVQFPEHTVLGEEDSHGEHSAAQFTWVVDPIDGTRPYALGVPTSVFSLALTEDGEVVAAVVYDPWLDRMYSATKGGGAFVNGQKMQVNSNAGVDKGTYFGFESRYSPWKYSVLTEWAKKDAHHFTIGSHVNVAMLVARGKLDFTVYTGNGAHDVATVALIVGEAGGIASDIDGNQQRYDQPVNGFICSNNAYHTDIAQTIKRHKDINNEGV